MFLMYSLSLLLLCCTLSVFTQNHGAMQRNCRNTKIGKTKFRYCSVDVNGDFWSFETFRKWSDRKPRQRKIRLDISCRNGGSIQIPWPMKARNLDAISVQGCLIKGYFDEFMNETIYPDSIQYLTVKDCSIETNIHDVIERSFLMKHASKGYNCGQETLVTSVLSNITYKFTEPSKPVDYNLLSESFDALTRFVHHKTYTCHFNKLVSLEQTVSSTRSKIFFEGLALGSRYPVLQKLNLSSNSLPYTSKYLKNWPEYFPALEILDLSNNNIKDFHFHPRSTSNTKPLYVDLRHNDVEKVPNDILEHFKLASPVIVDLRGNPIDCSYCSVSLLKIYLHEVANNYPSYNFIQDVTCASPPNLQGRRVLDAPKSGSCVS